MAVRGVALADRAAGPDDLACLAACAPGRRTARLDLAAVQDDDPLPDALREASYGLGARRMTTCLRVVVPAAVSGLVAALILSFSRALGETMVVTLAAGARPVITFDPRDAIATMTAFIANAAQSDQEAGSVGAKALFAVGATLFLITLLLNIISHQVVARFSEKYD